MKKKLMFIITMIILTFNIFDVSFANDYVEKYPGNVELEYVGLKKDYSKYFKDISLPGFSSSLLGDTGEIDRYVYAPKGTTAYFASNMENNGKSFTIYLNFSEDCHYRIFMNNTEMKPEEIDERFGSVMLFNVASYTILVSKYSGDDFFKEYARYECDIVLPDELIEAQHIVYGLSYHVDPEDDTFVYTYDGNDIFKTNVLIGTVTDKKVNIELLSNFNFSDAIFNGEKDNTFLPSSYIKQFSLDKVGTYELYSRQYSLQSNSVDTAPDCLAFYFTIGKEICTCEDFYVLPCDTSLLSMKYNGMSVTPQYINNRTIALKENGKYSLELKAVGLKEEIDDTSEDMTSDDINDSETDIENKTKTETKTETETKKETEKKESNDDIVEKSNEDVEDAYLIINETIDKNERNNLISFDKDISKGYVSNTKINIIKAYDDVELLIYCNGYIFNGDVLDKSGTYSIEAYDKYGNYEMYNLSIRGLFF